MIIGIDASRAFGESRTGTENYSYHIITHMLLLPESRKHKFVLFVRPNTNIPAWCEIDNRASKTDSWPENIQVKVIPWRYLWTQVGLALATWQEAKIDVLWIPAHTLPVLRNPSIRTVVTIHGLEYEWLPEYKNWLQKWYLPLSTIYATKYATKLIAVSNFTKKQLVQSLKTASQKIKVIHEGVELGVREGRGSGAVVSQFGGMAARQRVLNKWKLKNKQYILFVGTIQPRKNLSFLIEVFANIPLTVRKQSKLVIAGNQGWMFEDVMQAPKKYDVSPWVTFTGRVSDEELSVLYESAMFYVQPSITEGFGLPVLEAMKASVAVVSSDGGALPEVVGEAGLIIPVCKSEEKHSECVTRWSEGIAKVITDPRMRERMAAAGKWRVRQFGWENAAAATLKYLLN